MGSDNGKALPFAPKAEGIPIVGQPFTFKSGHPTVVIQCNCEAHEPVVLVGTIPAFCPACQRGFACAGFTFANGRIDVQIGLVVATRPQGDA